MKTATFTDENDLHRRVVALMTEALHMGLTFTVEELPVKPLRMGNKVPEIKVHRMTDTYRRQLDEFLGTDYAA